MYTYGNLVKDRRDDLMRTATRCRLAAQARQARGPRRHRARAVPARLLAGIYQSGVGNATLAGGAMRFKLAGAIGLGLLLAIIGASAASATTNTITVGSNATLSHRFLISVPVTVVCDPLTDSFIDASVSVNVQQANGRQIASASGSVFSGSTNFLTCDGVTQNHVVVQATPNAGSPPFHGGPAFATANFLVENGIIFPGCCFQVTNSDSGSSPITQVSLSG